MNATTTKTPASHPIDVATLLTQLEWRYATKKFDSSRKIPAATWSALERALVLAPSSYGLQPWKFFVVDNPKLRAELVAASWNQTQIADASHLVVFAVRRGLGEADVDRFIASIAQVRGVARESLEGYRHAILGSVLRPEAEVEAWSSRQVYIALGQFLVAAALLGVDACPMEGIDTARYDELLGLPAQGYHALVVATAGYRASSDAYASNAKVRFPLEQVVAHIA